MDNSSNENPKELKSLMKSHHEKEKELNLIKSQNQEYKDKIISQEKEILDLRSLLTNIGKNEKIIKLNIEQIETLEKEKYKISEEFQLKEKNYLFEISKLKKQIEDLNSHHNSKLEQINSKIEISQKIEKLCEIQDKDIKILESEIKCNLKQYQDEIDLKKIKSGIKFTEMKNKMIEHLKNTQNNVEQLNLAHMEVSTKLTLLQNHQLLIELEYQTQQVEDLLKKKTEHENKIFELNRDIEIHKEVENVLAEKNKKCIELIKNLTNSLEKEKNRNSVIEASRQNSPLESMNIPYPTNVNSSNFKGQQPNNSIYINFNNGSKTANSHMHQNSQLTEVNNTTYIQNITDNNIKENSLSYSNLNLITRLEYKVQKLEKIIENKKSEYLIIKTNYDILKDRIVNYEKKYRGLFNLFNEGIEKVTQDEPSLKNKEININIDNLRNCDFDNLSSEKRYSILLLLMKKLVPLLSSSEIKGKSQANLSFMKINPMNRSIEKNGRFIGGDNFSMNKKFSIDLPNIKGKSFVDKRFQIPLKPSIMN